MNNNQFIEKSINVYTASSQDCKIMKILMSPIELLNHLQNKPNTNNQANKNLCDLITALTNDEAFTPQFDENVLENQWPTPFIKRENDLYHYLVHIQNILLQSYLNYHDPNKQIPSKLYRSVSAQELEYLKINRKIDTLWSTTSKLDSAIFYTLEEAEHEWNPKEHFIIELSIKNKIPFVDVEIDAKRIYEPNEFILTPPFNVSKLKLVKKGGMDSIGFYSYNTIPIYSAEIKTDYNFEAANHVDYEQLVTQFLQIARDINKYGNMIEAYLNNEFNYKNLLHNPDYIIWARNLINLISMLEQYINEYAKECITYNNESPKMKILQ